MKILGIDPGSRLTGWGIISDNSGSLRLIDCGVIRTKSSESASRFFARRLSYIYHELHAIIQYYQPDEVGIEQVFTAQNPMSALKLGQARGIAVAACAAHRLDVHDYAPTLVKKSLVGVGRAEKEQVAFMVGKILNIKTQDMKLDTTDALGVAICHHSMRRYKQLEMKS